MRALLTGIAILGLAIVLAAQSESPDRQYLGIYRLIQQADALNETGQLQAAAAKYREALSTLRNFQAALTNWNENVVQFRLNYLREKLGQLSLLASTPVPPANAAASETNGPPPADFPTNAPPASAARRLDSSFRLPSPEPLTQPTNTVPIVNLLPEADTTGQIRALTETVRQLGADKAVLEAQLRVLSAHPSPALNADQLAKADDTIRLLQKENELLKLCLRQDQERIRRVASLEARLAALEGWRIPFTSNELAQFRLPELAPATVRQPVPPPALDTNTPATDVPTRAEDLAKAARADFAARRYTQAERKYSDLLAIENTNTMVLGNLAAIQLKQQHLTDAEANLKRALELKPDDALNLALEGILKYRQGQFEAALDALSRSARLEPDNAWTRNCLGIALCGRGHREAAEAEFLKTIQLNPNCAEAHYNLALLYALRDPPMLSLAKNNYEKALALGLSKNGVLEKLLAPARTAGNYP